MTGFSSCVYFRPSLDDCIFALSPLAGDLSVFGFFDGAVWFGDLVAVVGDGYWVPGRKGSVIK